ncbi:MAG: Superoxide dismutase [Chthoniobacteraceae bacterium]|nr:Superoxide dismutase [Chthoniobacteraceae bacterium]
MITRRHALKTLALTSGAIALSCEALRAQTPAVTPAAAAEPEGVFKLPPLGYDYDALEPFIDAETMKLHHDKHHAAYVSKLNQALAKAPGLEKKSIEQILANLDAVPEEIRKDVRNQGGGHANHTFFWQLLKKNEGALPGGALAKRIDTDFGSIAKFQEQFAAAAGKVFGSGWVWLAWRDKKLGIETTANQDSPIMTGGTPIIAIDVWEHAYYLKYQNRRPEYIKAFQSVINWNFASESFDKIA